MEEKTIPIAAEHEGYIQGITVAQSLLHTGAQAVFVILGFDDGKRHVLLVLEHIISAAPLTTDMQPTTDDDSTRSERKLFTHLALYIPARL